MIFHKSCIDWVALEGKVDLAVVTLPQDTICHEREHENAKALQVH